MSEELHVDSVDDTNPGSVSSTDAPETEMSNVATPTEPGSKGFQFLSEMEAQLLASNDEVPVALRNVWTEKRWWRNIVLLAVVLVTSLPDA